MLAIKQGGVTMINELEVRITYTEAQIKQAEAELRKVQDQINYLQGSLHSYNEMLEFIRKQEDAKPKAGVK